jgi:hypothetical protein
MPRGGDIVSLQLVRHFLVATTAYVSTPTTFAVDEISGLRSQLLRLGLGRILVV